MRQVVILLFLLLGCGEGVEPKEPALDGRIEQLREIQYERIQLSYQIRDENGWLAGRDCDGMVWAGKYAAATDVAQVNIEASEFTDEPGRFGRRAEPRCWTPEEGDQGAKATWSRDQANLGLLPYAWRKQNRDLLERHASYGEANNWQMGEPRSETRVVYSPQLVGLLYQAIFALGGEDNFLRKTPQVYPSGLDDYEAHNQMMSIWLRAEIAEALNDQEEVPRPALLNVSETMHARIIEHSDREPENPFYWALRGIYTGDFTQAIDLCLREDMPVGSYVRCNDFKQCQLAEIIFACDLILRRFTDYGPIDN